LASKGSERASGLRMVKVVRQALASGDFVDAAAEEPT
jgi:hypothetical protein